MKFFRRSSDGVHAQLVGQDVHAALDRVAGFRDAERTAIGDAAGRLVREVGVDLGVGDRERIAAGDDAEDARRILAGIGRRVERAVIGRRRDVQRRDLAVGGRADLHVHVVVAGEAGARQVLGARLDPLDRPSDLQRADDRADVSGIHRHLVAEAAAEIRRDDVDLVLGDAGDERERRAIDVRRLRRHVKLQAPHRVEVRDAAARLERGGMAALEPDALLDPLRARRHRAGRAVLVADFPMEDVVGLLFAVRTEQHLVGLRGERIGHDRQRRVVDLHRLGAVDGRRARLGEHGGDFLILEEHLADRQDHLLVEPVEGRQPPETGGLEVLARDDRHHAGHLHRLADVDVLDLGVRVGAPHQREVEHARQREVVDVVALASKEARIFLALHGDADRMQRLRLDAHGCSPVSVAAACCTAFTMFW